MAFSADETSPCVVCKSVRSFSWELSLKAFSQLTFNTWGVADGFSHSCCSVIIDDVCGCCPRYIKTSGNATVDHLSKYLAVRLALEELRSKGESNQMNLDTASEKQYTIYIATAAGQFTVSSSTAQPCTHLCSHPAQLGSAPPASGCHRLL